MTFADAHTGLSTKGANDDDHFHPFRPDAEVSAGYWIIDPTHSRIGFRVRNWIVATVPGAFAEYDGALDWRNEAERSTATLSLSAASIGTGVDTRDAHLCSAHFFDADRYPTITFSSTEIEPLGDDRYRFHGDLTIRDVTRMVVLDVRLERSSGADSEQQLRISGHGCIDRHDFGLSYGPNSMISNLRIGARFRGSTRWFDRWRLCGRSARPAPSRQVHR